MVVFEIWGRERAKRLKTKAKSLNDNERMFITYALREAHRNTARCSVFGAPSGPGAPGCCGTS